jgi:cell division protease FtsH
MSIPEQSKPEIWRLILFTFTAMLALWAWQAVFQEFAVHTIPYSQFKAHLEKGEVTTVAIKPDEVIGRIGPKAHSDRATARAEEVRPYFFRSIRVDDPDLVRQLEAARVEYAGYRPSALSQLLLSWMLPLVLMFGVWSFLGRRLGAASSLLSIGKSRARLVVDKNTGVTFDEVAGCDEAKQELQEVVQFLKNPDQYKELGARIPKGILLVGPPGTGKTLLARAVAGEAKVAFFSISGSDFIEMFVGVGAARVRDMFQQAKAQSPCIIFIDELDAIGRQRSVHVGAVNDEREQTLNALLVEMDGFEPNSGVIILAATNRPEILDRALLRPGRFDRQVVVDAPDLDGREAILKVHTRGKKLAGNVDLHRIARATAGFSGADLANVLNEAALLAARRRSKTIAQGDLEEAIEKVVAGPERKSRRLTPEDKRRIAYHEVGHALVAAHSEGADPVHKISIVPRGRAALGYTMQLPHDDQFLLTREQLAGRIRTLLGGRAAEEVVYGEVTTGAQNDLERATTLARQVVAMYGMSERVGLANCVQRQPAFLPNGDAQFHRDCSEATARDIDEEVRDLLDRSYAEAKEILTTHRNDLEQVTRKLVETETIPGSDFYEMIRRDRDSVSAAENHFPSKTRGDFSGATGAGAATARLMAAVSSRISTGLET